MATTTVADYLLSRLRDWGVDKVFAFPGDGINGILAAWGRADNFPRFVQSRHEEMSAFEAVQELAYSAPTHAFKMVASSIGLDWPTTVPRDAAIMRAAEVLNAGQKVAILAGSGARGPARNSSRSPSCSGPAWPSRCSARTYWPMTCRTSPARSDCSALGPATR